LIYFFKDYRQKGGVNLVWRKIVNESMVSSPQISFDPVSCACAPAQSCSCSVPPAGRCS